LRGRTERRKSPSPPRDGTDQTLILLSRGAWNQNPRRAGTAGASTTKGTNMKRLILAAGLSLFALQASAAATCQAMAAEKKLSGAAKGSFIQKCERDARAKCDAAANKQKLSGAARDSSLKKCVDEATGPYSNASCQLSADAKKLYGAARSSHIKKCMAPH